MARHRSGKAHGDGREAEIVAAIHGFRRAFSGFQRLMHDASSGQVAMADLFALQSIAHLGSATPGEIGTLTGLTSGAVTTMLDRLEAAGYVGRARSTTDRRVVRVALRPRAQTKVVALMLDAHARAARVFDGWSSAKVRTLVGLLGDLDWEAAAGPRGSTGRAGSRSPAPS